jgi:hypothetical protein
MAGIRESIKSLKQDGALRQSLKKSIVKVNVDVLSRQGSQVEFDVQ